ncbi:class I SAM-dependent methyltransferase [Heyndrickxia acidicola]|uniref:rRNA adenine N-6-methyltransferase family protein n=1 Tax=Heyndrickxia acidicola TaxID=209389 RepID=A0ABU6MIK1_9BACI|nr:rRNA adenine N-6-methyltransferase family protein [Heyndrickxia acidicola]MED1204499.1 rRNA adenine N-6-methyltransferase family protein [Heyndrickxia acidicola]
MKSLAFFIQYLTKPRTVGAIWPSSHFLAKKMVKDIAFDQTSCIVEYGPGTGIFTEQIIKNRQETTFVLLIEANKEFYKLLKSKFGEEKNVFIEHGSAEHIDDYLTKHQISHVDYIVSGLPFASLPSGVSNTILEKTRKVLGGTGRFITFQYTLFKMQMIRGFFNQIEVDHEFRNMPPAYVLNCKGAPR